MPKPELPLVGRFEGASGGGTATVKVAGGIATIKGAGTITLP